MDDRTGGKEDAERQRHQNRRNPLLHPRRMKFESGALAVNRGRLIRLIKTANNRENRRSACRFPQWQSKEPRVRVRPP